MLTAIAFWGLTKGLRNNQIIKTFSKYLTAMREGYCIYFLLLGYILPVAWN